MALLLPNLRQVLKYGAGIKDRATQTAVQALESWSDDLVRRLSRLEESTGGGVPTTRTISTTSPLSGGGDLSANRTLAVADNSVASKGVVAVAPNDTTKFYRGDATWATLAGLNTGLYAPVLSAVPTGASSGFSAWWYQWTGATYTDGVMGPLIKVPTTGGANRWSGRVKTAPAAPYTITMLLGAWGTPGGASNHTVAYVGWSDGSTGTTSKGDVWYWRPNSGGNSGGLTLTNATTVLLDSGTGIAFTNGIPTLWVRMADDGTTATVSTSATGDPDSFIVQHTKTKSGSHLGATGYNYVIFGTVPFNAVHSTIQLLSYKQA